MTYYKATYKKEIGNLIAKPNGSTIVVGSGGLALTEKHIIETINSNSWQVREFAKEIKGATLEQTVFNIWHYIKTQFEYKLDKDNTEELRTPARMQADKIGDCDDFSIFGASALKELGYNPFLYIVAYNGNKNFGHIYVGIENFVLDGVMDKFNQHAQNITKTKILTLKGKQETIFKNASKINTMQVEILNGIETPKNFNEKKIIEVLANKGKAQREALDNIFTQETSAGIDGIVYENHEIAEASEQLFGIAEKIDALQNTNNLAGWLQDQFNALKKKFNNAVAELKNLKEKSATRLKEVTGNLSLKITKLESQLKTAKENVKNQIAGALAKTKSLLEKTKKELQKAKEKTGVLVKKVGDSKIFKSYLKVQFAPVRGAYLLLIKVNFLKQASNLYIGGFSNEKAKELKLDQNEFTKLVNARKKFLKFWASIGGDVTYLDKAIKKSWGIAKANKALGLGVEPVTTASATSIATSATIWTKLASYFKSIDFKKLFQFVKDAKELLPEKKQTTDNKETIKPDTLPDNETDTSVETQPKKWLIPAGIFGSLILIYAIS